MIGGRPTSARYLTSVREPITALVEALAGEFGTPRIFRPQRDTRFSHDKSPYKTRQDALLQTGDVLGGGVGYFLRIGADGLVTGGGYHHTAADQVARFRAAVDSELTGPALVELVDALRHKGFEVHGDTVRTRPRGVPANHPRLELMRHQSLIVTEHHGTPDWLSSPACRRPRPGLLRTGASALRLARRPRRAHPGGADRPRVAAIVSGPTIARSGAVLPDGRPLVGQVVRLDEAEPADAAALFSALDDERVYRYGYGGGPAGRPTSPEPIAAAIAAARVDPSRTMYVVRLLTDSSLGAAGTVVGTSTLGDAVPVHRRIHIGWTGYAPAVWATAVNPECKLLLLGLAFDELRVRPGQDPDGPDQRAIPGGHRQARRGPGGGAAPPPDPGRRVVAGHRGVLDPRAGVAGRPGPARPAGRRVVHPGPDGIGADPSTPRRRSRQPSRARCGRPSRHVRSGWARSWSPSTRTATSHRGTTPSLTTMHGRPRWTSTH